MIIPTVDIAKMQKKWNLISSQLDERSRRIWCGVEAEAYGYGGVMLLHLATGMSRSTIAKGRCEARVRENQLDIQRVRAKGGGRNLKIQEWPDLLEQIDNLIQPFTKGDPMSPLRWTSKSTYRISEELGQRNYRVSPATVGSILKKQGYSLQLNRKEKEGGQHEDRDAQFQFINDRVKAQIASDQAAISVDTKKKELVGAFKNAGREYHPKGEPPQVNVHDFADKTLGKVAPYGVYDVEFNEGWVSVGVSADTASFAVNTVREWWYKMGKERYAGTERLLITADGGGSNSSRSRLFKVELQQLANELNMIIDVSHFPPGTSKWNKIEHRMFSFISKNWRGKPLLSQQAVVELIGNTTTKTGLKIQAALDERTYEKGIKVSDEELAQLNMTRNQFHGEWNYSIAPNGKTTDE